MVTFTKGMLQAEYFSENNGLPFLQLKAENIIFSDNFFPIGLIIKSSPINYSIFFLKSISHQVSGPVILAQLFNPKMFFSSFSQDSGVRNRGVNSGINVQGTGGI